MLLVVLLIWSIDLCRNTVDTIRNLSLPYWDVCHYQQLPVRLEQSFLDCVQLQLTQVCIYVALKQQGVQNGQKTFQVVWPTTAKIEPRLL